MKTKLLLVFFLFCLLTKAQTNLVPNGDFENWSSSSQPDSWFGYFSGEASQSATAQSGMSSVKMKILDGTINFINTGFFPVVANKTYRVTAYHKLVSGTFTSLNFSLYHKPSVFKEEIAKKTDETFSSSTWTKIEFEYTPTVSENVEVDIWTNGTVNSEILIDNVSMVDVADLPVQYTLIPDSKFEAELIALGIDDAADGKVLTSKINTITSLDVSASSITDLTGIQDFIALTDLNCALNQLKSVDVSKNIALIKLNLDANDLLSLDVSKNTALNFLHCNSNFLSTIDISNNLNLKELDFAYNQITTVDLSKHINLNTLYCYNNLLTSLDISKNTNLRTLSCHSNKLESLNLKNGSNISLTVSLKNNRSLSCILVDDLNYSNTQWADDKDDTAFYSSYDCSLVTEIPDGKFEDKLIALGIDTDGKNGLVRNTSIEARTTLDVSNSFISDLTGIQGFIGLKMLNCSGNLIKKLDLSKTNALTTLNCSNNSALTCIQVADVAFAKANWSTIKDDIASFNLDCGDYTLIPDDKFEEKLIALGIDTDGKNGKVATKSIMYLTLLNVSSSEITNLTGIEGFTSLTILKCNSNKLTSLDISQNKFLKELNCSSNQLSSLNLKNGNNTLMYTVYLNFSWNPNLYCILVDDVAYANANWANKKQDLASYNSVECNVLTLSADNFTIETKGESCLGENNGEINITATAAYAYRVTVNGLYQSFINNKSTITNLAPGNYTVSITIPGETFEQIFNLVIPKGATITGKSSVSSKKVNVEITDGTAPYTVFVNGVEQFETSSSNFSVSAKGNGLLEVKTAKACEGTYTEDILGLDMNISAYPNPTSGSFEIELPVSNKEVTIEINTLEGRVISNKKYSLENGTAQLTLENEPNGIYIAKIYLDTIKSIKIIKN